MILPKHVPAGGGARELRRGLTEQGGRPTLRVLKKGAADAFLLVESLPAEPRGAESKIFLLLL